MELQVNYLNNEQPKQDSKSDIVAATWHSKCKTYIAEDMDADMKVCTISHKVDRVILNDIQITSKSQVEDLIDFLKNLKPSLQY
jgi:hypothetical protein